ncbi:MAG: peptidylprolyl isomerase [Pseudomonadota bacterium]
MIRLNALRTAILVALAPLAAPALADEPEEILPQTLPVALDESDAARTEVGELIYRGGLKVEPGEEKIGGISGLEWVEDEADYGGGALWAVSDDGRWLKIVPDETNGRLTDLYSIEMGPLRDLKGKKLKKKQDADAEAITRLPDGGWAVAFEQDHRIWRYDDFAQAATLLSPNGAVFPYPLDANKGLETFDMAGTDTLTCGEYVKAEQANCIRLSGDIKAELTVSAELAEVRPVPTDAACDGMGVCYIVMRSYMRGVGNHIAVLEHSMTDGLRTLAVLKAPLTRDNIEGLALREQFGKRYLYLASDDNFNNCYERDSASCQDTLIMKFEIKRPEEAAPPLVEDAPEPDPVYETTNVVLQTELGSITIALETERAPITAANFLRYVEEGRLDGTVFYRAMSLPIEPQPNGLIQGGVQFDPKRVLPPIAHEPTTQTGLSHTNGALSMAMGEPGSATGDFSIMLQDQIGLDARPDAKEAVWQNGYAVFGYVIEGMDVVAAIHGSGNDPNKGQGAMRGQMLAEPVKIVTARRAKPALASEPEN